MSDDSTDDGGAEQKRMIGVPVTSQMKRRVESHAEDRGFMSVAEFTRHLWRASMDSVRGVDGESD